MKILYHYRTASRDGQSTHIDEMICGLRADGHSVIESSPFYLFEYLALGKAIVAPDQPNCHEIQSSGVALRGRIALAAPDLILCKQPTWRRHARQVVGLVGSVA